MQLDRALIFAAAAALLSGCHSAGKLKSDCRNSQEYQQARQMPPLTVPAGLDSINTQGALAIPTVAVSPPPPTPTDTCLDVPPRYRPAPQNKAGSEAPVAVPKPVMPNLEVPSRVAPDTAVPGSAAPVPAGAGGGTSGAVPQVP